MCMLSADFCGHLKTHAEVCHAMIDATMPARASGPIPRDTDAGCGGIDGGDATPAPIASPPCLFDIASGYIRMTRLARSLS